ncbi:PREDICTED: uncharacterized protein LOC105969657 [Erythranthe guttata]|uniref:uncharacterized protein LOC105969657 n=1 Tax=Erythranthe guttata TaxID=4155 RepID=UPI00064DCCF1|nr:PREDICTED: uncharacterized protein LOC105969657 [Erythranthe guttata]|eukprot:XP_012849884.1 PREDICTED: uncharacterized protein LOC105969657 [Erythranthe guttata]
MRNRECRLALIKWSRTFLRQPQKVIDDLHKKINLLKSVEQTETIREEINTHRVELERAYEDNDLYWRQRSRVQWIKEGDRNTRFFHSTTTIRHRTNRVERIKNAVEIWTGDNEGIERIISEYFEHIFKSTNPREEEIDEVLECIEARLAGGASQLLSQPYTSDEVTRAISQMDPLKSPGPDGLARFHLRRGLRQGDPLSPYLFICCAEVLIAMVARVSNSGEFLGVQVAPTAPVVSCLCFADDTLVFERATEEYARVLKNILGKYARASGQEINQEKLMEKYLGLPAAIGRTKKEIFAYLRDRLWSKIKGWGEKQLSRAGKEVMIKAVLQAIPSYVMGCFLLPEGIINDVEAAIKRYWWGHGGNRGLAWVAWNDMCKSKGKGGMGFRDLKSFNLAMITKQVWRIFTSPNMLLSRVISAKYYPQGSLFNATLGYCPSSTWRNIWKTIPYLRQGLQRLIGNSRDTSLWADPWLKEGGSLCLFTKRPMGVVFPDRVSDIIDDSSNSWNMDLLNEFIWPVDIERISAVPLCNGLADDKWVWHCSKNGRFSVKSCYHMILAHRIEHEKSTTWQGGRW